MYIHHMTGKQSTDTGQDEPLIVHSTEAVNRFHYSTNGSMHEHS